MPASPRAVDAARIEAFASMRVVAPVLAAVAIGLAIGLDHGTVAEAFLVAGTLPLFVVWAIWPRVDVLALTLCVTFLVLLAVRGGDLEPSMFLLSIAATVVGSFERSPWRLAVASVVLGCAPGFATLFLDAELSAGIWTAGIVLPLLLTFTTRRQARLSLELAEARAGLADQMVAEERRRIARDVHDSVGHGLAAMLLHITGARHVLRRDVDSADEALAEAEAVGRRSMLELRQTLGLLRSEAGTAAPAGRPGAPIPGASHISELGVTVDGDPDRIDPLVGLSLHRVAEEALANARRHSRSLGTRRLEIGEDRVVLTIESVGITASDGGAVDGPRYGIVGMGERMAAVGGTLEAGPTPTGWLVTAVAPIDAANGARART